MIKIFIMFLIFWIWQNFPMLYGHRSIVHKHFVFHPWIVDFVNIIKWTQNFNFCPYWVKPWVATHLKHHATTDTEHDPHTPHYHSFLDVVTSKPRVPISEDDENFYNKSYNITTTNLSNKLGQFKIGPIVMLITFLLIFSWSGIILWLACISTWYLPGVFNYIAHISNFGYRNEPARNHDQSVNMPMFFCLIFGGEELHANHHQYPGRVNNAIRWWEFDIGYQLLKILSWCGLVKFNR